MCIIYKSVDDFLNNVLFVVSPSFFGDVNEFINTKYEKICYTNLQILRTNL